MGEHYAYKAKDEQKRAAFTGHLLRDVEALELMLSGELIENDVTRIGAEQEFCLVTPEWRPHNNAEQILAKLNDRHFTTEMALYNLEINIDPVELLGDALSHMEGQLHSLLNKARQAAASDDSRLVLTGILPTITKQELTTAYLTPQPRYDALNAMVRKMRGEDFALHFKGVDELAVLHDSVMFEACNTSFQMHLQVSQADFIASYNWAQAIAGPVLAISANAPLLLGRELWHETRIALFQQSVEPNRSTRVLKDSQARVNFGYQWASGSVADIFKDDVARYPVMLIKELDYDPVEQLKKGIMPSLQAMCLHNGTIYRWNRACVGLGGGKPHLRIENRYVPAGPTVLDEMANFAFWVGLMVGRPARFDDMPACMDFKDAKGNFIKAARTGKESVMVWEGKPRLTTELVREELLPIARDGLQKMNLAGDDIERFLGVIRKRVEGNTGAEWQIRNYRNLRQQMKQDKALVTLTKAMYRRQQSNTPVHEWGDIEAGEGPLVGPLLVGQLMSTRLIIANQHDLAVLAVRIMEWKGIHHVLVTDDTGALTGLLTWSYWHKYYTTEHASRYTLADVMISDVLTTTPYTPIAEARKTMAEQGYGCLPVLEQGEVVGIITTNDLTGRDDNAV